MGKDKGKYKVGRKYEVRGTRSEGLVISDF